MLYFFTTNGTLSLFQISSFRIHSSSVIAAEPAVTDHVPHTAAAAAGSNAAQLKPVETPPVI
jgi:hypothetical protein